MCMPKELSQDVETDLSCPVSQQPAVVEATEAYQRACRELEPVQQEYRRLVLQASPTADETASETRPVASRLEKLEAAAQLPEARKQLLLLQAKVEQAEQRVSQVRMATKDGYSDARRQSPQRQGMMQTLHDNLAKYILPVVREIADYDQETELMGGYRGEPVYAELDPRNRDNVYEFRRRRWEEAGEL
jgi:hypothetical protein